MMFLPLLDSAATRSAVSELSRQGSISELIHLSIGQADEVGFAYNADSLPHALEILRLPVLGALFSVLATEALIRHD
jgi:hypothetical protein